MSILLKSFQCPQNHQQNSLPYRQCHVDFEKDYEKFAASFQVRVQCLIFPIIMLFAGFWDSLCTIYELRWHLQMLFISFIISKIKTFWCEQT